MKTREIKFRGQKTETKEWVYGSLIVDPSGNPHAICQQRQNPVQNGQITGWVFGVIPETVGQFLGLKDKNGTDIYEGDTYKYEYEYDSDYDGDMPIVKTAKGNGIVKNIFDTYDIKRAKTEGEGVEITGTIHEKPKSTE